MSLLTPYGLLQQVRQQQQTAYGGLWVSLLPSFRYNTGWLYRRPDQNLFFTAITAFTLQRLDPLLSAHEQALARAIAAAATGTYPAFRNVKALDAASPGNPLSSLLGTYNFYATQPSRHFPNGWLMHRLRHFKLPDDIDDTAMVYLTTRPTAADLAYLHRKLALHANGTRLTIRNAPADYQLLRAYSTWFGEHMPIEFDACALANMLYCVYEYGLPVDEHARDSLTLLAHQVRSGRYRTDPFRCAPNYAQTPLIAYHLARLMATHDPPLLRPVRPQLLADLRDLHRQTPGGMERVLLGTSLMRLGEVPPPIDLTGIEGEFRRFSFFRAGMLSAFGRPLLYRLAPHPFWHIRWQCDAYCRVLLVEYLALVRSQS